MFHLAARCPSRKPPPLTPLFDIELVLARKRRALAQAVTGADFLMQRAAGDLAERLAIVGRRFPEAAALFCWTGAARDTLAQSGKVDRILRVEADRAFLPNGEGIAASLETVPLPPASLDLAVSLLSLHEVNDLPGMLIQIRQAMKGDGLFLAALPGAGTLGELRESLLAAESEAGGGASARVIPFADVRDAGSLLQRAGFALPVADVETVTVRYDSLFALMADLRAMGAANTLLRRMPPELRDSPEGRLLADAASEKVFRIVHFIYRSRHYEGDSKDYEFSRLSMLDHWKSGYLDAVRSLRHTEALARPTDPGGVATFDLARDSGT